MHMIGLVLIGSVRMHKLTSWACTISLILGSATNRIWICTCKLVLYACTSRLHEHVWLVSYWAVQQMGSWICMHELALHVGVQIDLDSARLNWLILGSAANWVLDMSIQNGLDSAWWNWLILGNASNQVFDTGHMNWLCDRIQSGPHFKNLLKM